MNFLDYTAEQLFDIANKMLHANSVVPDAQASAHLKSYMEFLYKGRDQYFGNARNVRKVVEETIKNQHLRLAKLPSEQRTLEMINTILLADVDEFKIEDMPNQGKRSIGFKQNS
jgi:hypothetical protein